MWTYSLAVAISSKPDSCAQQNDVNATRRSAGISSFCQAHAFQSGHLLQLIANSSFVWFIRRNFIASQILSSKIISWNFICNAKGILKSWECYRSRPFAGNKHARSHCQFSCQARTFTSFCRAHECGKNGYCQYIIMCISWCSIVAGLRSKSPFATM